MACILLQALIQHKWHSHARRYLITEIGLYPLATLLLLVDLSLIGRSIANHSQLGHSGALIIDFSGAATSNMTANGLRDLSPTSLVSSLCEVSMLGLVARGIWYATSASQDWSMQASALFARVRLARPLILHCFSGFCNTQVIIIACLQNTHVSRDVCIQVGLNPMPLS